MESFLYIKKYILQFILITNLFFYTIAKNLIQIFI